MEDDTLILGDCIQLTGFKGSDPGELIVVKKIVGHFVEKYSKTCKKFHKLVLVKKDVHKKEQSQKYELQGKLLEENKTHSVNAVDYNLFLALDDVLKKLEKIIEKECS